jgi:gamma-glutamylcyclotransferase (GGCT)/AIG2-like uncharacterized protein YtfP
MSTRLFAYGLLQFPEVLEVLLGKTFPMTAAHVQGYRCYRVDDPELTVPYPAAAPWEDAMVHGVLLPALTQAAWTCLDRFESAEYRHEVVAVSTVQGLCEAVMYVWDDDPRLLRGVWDAEAFRRESLAGYVDRLRA